MKRNICRHYGCIFYESESNFNIWGEGVQTTYNDHGYDTVLNVNGSETNIKKWNWIIKWCKFNN